MAIITFSRDTLIDYVPAYGGNRDSDNPCVVRIRFVSYAKVQEYTRILASRAKGIRQDDFSRMREIAGEVQKKQFVENVDSVENFLVDGQPIKDAGLFYEHAPSELIHEVIKAMEDSAKLTEGQRKN